MKMITIEHKLLEDLVRMAQRMVGGAEDAEAIFEAGEVELYEHHTAGENALLRAAIGRVLFGVAEGLRDLMSTEAHQALDAGHEGAVDGLLAILGPYRAALADAEEREENHQARMADLEQELAEIRGRIEGLEK